jgi:hypothetical protein
MPNLIALPATASHLELLGVNFLPTATAFGLAFAVASFAVEASALLLVFHRLADLSITRQSAHHVLLIHDFRQVALLDVDVVLIVIPAVIPSAVDLGRKDAILILMSVHQVAGLAAVLDNLVQFPHGLDDGSPVVLPIGPDPETLLLSFTQSCLPVHYVPLCRIRHGDALLFQLAKTPIHPRYVFPKALFARPLLAIDSALEGSW